MSSAYAVSPVHHVTFGVRPRGERQNPRVISWYGSRVHVMLKRGNLKKKKKIKILFVFRRFLMWKKEKKKKKRGAIASTYLLQNMSPRLHALQDILYTRCTVRGTVYVRRIHSYTMNAIFHMAFITQHMMQNILRLRCKNTTCAIIEISLASGHVVTIPAFTALRFIQRTRRVSSRDLD